MPDRDSCYLIMDKYKIDILMHRLWTKAVGTRGYEKKEWIELERAIWETSVLKLKNELPIIDNQNNDG